MASTTKPWSKPAEPSAKTGRDDRLFLIAALARLSLGEVDTALELLGQAIALAPDNDDLYRALRDICQREERFRPN